MNTFQRCCSVLVLVSCTACTGLLRDPRDAPWDPRHPNELLTQLHFEGKDNPTQCGMRLRPEQRTARHTTRC
jgi:hypothetical protein